MGVRRRGRESALQLLFQIDAIAGTDVDDAIRLFRSCFQESPDAPPGTEESRLESHRFCEELVHGVHQHLDKIDEWIRRCSQNWRIERMARVDRNILRMATFELLYETDVPKSVIIDEAIEIAKRFGSADSAAFVNGIVDRIANQIRTS
jgi:transcription antitermination protein NusB